MTKKLTVEFVRGEFEKRGFELLSNVYSRNSEKLECRCNNGHNCTTCFRDFATGHGCKFCANKLTGEKQRHTIEFINKQFALRGYELLSTSYLGAHEKLHYLCDKSHQCFINYSNFKKGSGCPTCSIYGFDTQKPGILYYATIVIPLGTFYKIGITNLTVKKRFGADYKNIESFVQRRFATGAEAYELEQLLLKKYGEFIYTGIENIFSNKTRNTEVFTENVLRFENIFN